MMTKVIKKRILSILFWIFPEEKKDAEGKKKKSKPIKSIKMTAGLELTY